MSFIDVPASLQIELSNVCNALCPTCKRNTVDWQVLKSMYEDNIDITLENLPVINVPEVSEAPNIYLKPNIIKDIVQSNVFKTIDNIQFVGTIDDPLASPHLLEILEIFLVAKPNITFHLHTNGSLRSPSFFTKLAKYFKIGTGNVVSFSIDGLEDTNHLYRRNCQWKKIIENATAFINAGGRAKWQFIEFKWNKHQLDEAKQLSEQMGFFKFERRPNIHTKWNIDVGNWAWEDFKDMGEPLYSGYVRPIAPKYAVRCSYKKRKQYHISYDGKLWPCCILNSARRHVKVKRHFEDNWSNRYPDKSWNDLNKYTIDEVVQHPFYQTDLDNSWNSYTHGPRKQDRIISCTISCSIWHRPEK